MSTKKGRTLKHLKLISVKNGYLKTHKTWLYKVTHTYTQPTPYHMISGSLGVHIVSLRHVQFYILIIFFCNNITTTCLIFFSPLYKSSVDI